MLSNEVMRSIFLFISSERLYARYYFDTDAFFIQRENAYAVEIEG